MADLYLEWGQDLVVSATGDLLLVDGITAGTQRVQRRLLTNPGASIWNLSYGAGLPAFIGTPSRPALISAIIINQMMAEQAVSQSPVPSVLVQSDNIGTMTATVTYVDSSTQQSIVLPPIPLTGT